MAQRWLKKYLILSLFVIFIITVGGPLFAETAENDEVQGEAEGEISAQTVTAQGIPAEPSGAKFSLTSTFANPPGESVDPGTGALIIKQTDILLPGNAGFDSEILRTYNSKAFRSNPKWNSFNSPKEIFDAADPIWKVKGIDKTIPLIPDQLGGWVGQGWQMSFSGRLIANYSRYVKRGSIISGVTALPDLPEYPDSITVQLPFGSFSFNWDMTPKDKGQYVKLIKTTAGYALIRKNGIKYFFEAPYYSKEVWHQHWDPPHESCDYKFKSYYLSSIEDPNGNKIKYVYESFGSRFEDGVDKVNDQTWTFLFLRGGYKNYYWFWYEPIRPAKIVDSFGRELLINYRSDDSSNLHASMVDHITYKDQNGSQATYRYVYDSNNCLVEVVPPEGNSTKFSYSYKNQGLADDFDDDGYILTKMTHPTGGTVNYAYDWYNPKDYDSNLTQKKKESLSSYVVSRRAVNNIHSWNYSFGGGNLYSRYGKEVKSDEDYDDDSGEAWNFDRVTVSDPAGDTEYEFENGLIKKEINPENHITDYVWDYAGKNLLMTTVNRGGTLLRTEYRDYDDYGNPGMVKEYGDLSIFTDDRELHFEYMHNRSALYETANILDRVSHAWMQKGGNIINEVYSDYDMKGNLIYQKETLDAGFAEIIYTYDASGNLVTEEDPNGHATHYAYAAGSPNPTRISNILTQNNSYFFNTGLLRTESDFNGNITSYAYDRLGRMTRKTNPDGTNVIYAYYDSSNRIEVKDENNRAATYRYDNLGRLVEVNQPEGSTIRYQYDPFSRITAVTESGKTTYYTYDKIGRITSVSYADGSNVSCNYIDSQNIVEVTDGEGNTTRYKYDGLGRLVQVTEADGSSSSYEYTPAGKISKITDPRGLFTNYTYDQQSRLIGIKYSNSTFNSFSYDKVGNLIRKTDAKGKSIRYDYDQINRLKYISYPDQSYDVSFRYDEASGGNGKGQLTYRKDRSGRSSFVYDRRGRLIRRNQTVGSLTSDLSYAFDGVGNVLSVKDPIGSHKTYYTYDELNRILEIKRDTPNSGQRTLATYSYNPQGTIREIQFLNGVRMSYTYDQRNRPDILRILDRSGNEMLKHDYDYDQVGNRTALNIAGVESITYDYDKVYRLIGVEYSNSEGSSHLNYDPAGNRTHFKYPYGDIKYTYELTSNQLDYLKINQHGKIDYSFDSNGNLVKEIYYKGNETAAITNYAYDPEDRLIRISYPSLSLSNTNTPNVTANVVSMVYDGGGRRVKKSSAVATILYHYDQSNNVICETDEQGNTEAYYIYANGQRICRIDPKGKMFFYHNDVLGSPALITDEDGEIIQRYLFEPFGSVLASKGKNENHYTFTGKEMDIESGLFYFGARYYDPKIGRFITKDVAEADYENPQSLNRYVYCLNNPLKYIDPSGLKALKAALYALRYLGGRTYGLPSKGSNTLNGNMLVCNEYVYYAYRKGEGVRGFPRNRFARGTGQIDWFRKRLEFIAPNEGAAQRAEIGDVVYFGARGSMKGHEEMVIATRYTKSGAKEVALEGARFGTLSGIYLDKSGKDLLWINLDDKYAVAKYFGNNPFRGIGQYKGAHYSAEEELDLMDQIRHELNHIGFSGGDSSLSIGIGIEF